MFCHEMVQTHLSGMGVEWLFNIEKAPWWGGVFERMVKSAKRCLRKMIGQAKFSLDELQTAVIEVESIINSRPLSYVAGRDGKVRGATVRLPTKNRQPVLLRRPLRLLYPLEVRSQEEGTATEAGTGDRVASKPTTAEPKDEVGPGDEVDCPPEAPREVVSRRPRRAAAKRADERRRACTFELDDY